MYEIFVNYLSPELMCQAEYIDGVLYLPAYEFFSEVLSCLFSCFSAVLIFAIITFVMDIVIVIVNWIVALVRRSYENKHHIQQDNG